MVAVRETGNDPPRHGKIYFFAKNYFFVIGNLSSVSTAHVPTLTRSRRQPMVLLVVSSSPTARQLHDEHRFLTENRPDVLKELQKSGSLDSYLCSVGGDGERAPEPRDEGTAQRQEAPAAAVSGAGESVTKPPAGDGGGNRHADVQAKR